MTAVVAAVGISRRYGPVTALAELSLAVAPGQILGVTGPSGVGKSTLLRLLAGLERPDTGHVAYAGEPAWAGRGVRYPRPGYVMPVFQNPTASLNPRWPIWRSLTEPLTAPGRERPGRARRRHLAAEWLARAHLDHIDPDTRPGALSGGQCQRVAVLRALVARPALIVADEPTARQDVITAAATSQLIAAATAAGTAAAVVVSHDRAWLAGLAHQIVDLA
ncbi:hypothetical protein GCM10010124_38260 [Pilimelia terevasa]|uniref:ABC transporter domain-containing protein n=1 Tax=Pilimelia terevasa TaxID=53372 RepID=A0A8J3FK13_9ACTN|nr:ATP-binding cassette domain-containing protein [Pilimelia terevasa]GGK41798.1 hypothetical protein GCM10010124_38260 [Pilimelia terevasa]